MNRRLLLIAFFLLFGLVKAQLTLPPNMYPDTAFAPYLYGVASFDPTQTNVLLWTKIDPGVANTAMALTCEVFSDSALNNLVASRTCAAQSFTDFTVSCDITGLQPGQYYWYRFRDPYNRLSQVGRTKTAAANDVSQVRLAVMSCSSIYSGYFNAYRRVGERNDIDLVVHLGDYVYDFVDADEQVRVPIPAPVDPVTLADWRALHSYYLLDPDLRLARQMHPWAVIWDNHDIDGDTPQAFSNAKRAFHEYVPMRLRDAQHPERIYRRLAYGNLLDILLFDVTSLRDVDRINGGEFSIMGDTQWVWLSEALSASTAKWRVLGQERMMAQFSTLGLGALINYGDGPVADSGSWDGYNEDRQRLLNHLFNKGIGNNVVLSGDIHCSFACDLPLDYGAYDAQTGAGSAAVEFLPTSISRGNFDEAGIPGFLIGLVQGAISLANSHHVYAELTSHGYGILDVQHDAVTAEYWYADILQQTSTESFATGFQCFDGQTHWDRNAISGPTTAIQKPLVSNALPIDVRIYPNPAADQLNLAVNSTQTMPLRYLLLEVATGKTAIAASSAQVQANHTREFHLDLKGLPSGPYLLVIEGNGKQATFQVQHTR
jgi:alkaline phosphatase D